MLLDKEDEDTVVDDSFEEFQEMYKPIMEKHFSDVMQVQEGKFLIDNESKAVQRKLLLTINDNVYKNLDGFSMRLFDRNTTISPQTSSQEAAEADVENSGDG